MIRNFFRSKVSFFSSQFFHALETFQRWHIWKLLKYLGKFIKNHWKCSVEYSNMVRNHSSMAAICIRVVLPTLVLQLIFYWTLSWTIDLIRSLLLCVSLFCWCIFISYPFYFSLELGWNTYSPTQITLIHIRILYFALKLISVT